MVNLELTREIADIIKPRRHECRTNSQKAATILKNRGIKYEIVREFAEILYLGIVLPHTWIFLPETSEVIDVSWLAGKDYDPSQIRYVVNKVIG